MKFRNLTEKEIDARVATVSEKGCSLLLYKDARCDMRILDETVGAERWQRTHELINGNLFCNVGINFNWNFPGTDTLKYIRRCPFYSLFFHLRLHEAADVICQPK